MNSDDSGHVKFWKFPCCINHVIWLMMVDNGWWWLVMFQYWSVYDGELAIIVHNSQQQHSLSQRPWHCRILAHTNTGENPRDVAVATMVQWIQVAHQMSSWRLISLSIDHVYHHSPRLIDH